MTLTNRLFKLLIAALYIACGIVMITVPDKGLYIIMAVLDVALLIYGIRTLVYYFTMGKYMVGGLMLLFRAIIVLDIAIFAVGLNVVPEYSSYFITIYFIIMYIVSGVLNIVRAIEAKSLGSKSWQVTLASGAVRVAISIACIVLTFTCYQIAPYIYAAAMFISALWNIYSAFRKTSVVYVNA